MINASKVIMKEARKEYETHRPPIIDTSIVPANTRNILNSSIHDSQLGQGSGVGGTWNFKACATLGNSQ